MIVKKYYKQNRNGRNLYRVYSDKGVYIKLINSDLLIAYAIDVYPSNNGYIETEVPIPIEVVEEPVLEDETNVEIVKDETSKEA